MCRRNLVVVVGLIAFGIGVLTGGWIESVIVRTLVATGAIGIGVCFLQEKRRHK